MTQNWNFNSSNDYEDYEMKREELERDGCPEKSSRISRKDRVRNVTIRKEIGLEETSIKRSNRTSSHGTAMFKEWQKEDCPK